MTTQEEFLIQEDVFRRNAFLLITEMVEMSPDHPSVLVDELLHSIFFLGKINNPVFSPKHILTDDEILNELKDRYPQPFQHYSSQVPKRSPMSCALDMIIHLMGQKNENEIIKRLHELTLQLKNTPKHLFSSAICVSQEKKDDLNSDRYYGVSLSTSGKVQREIMVAASCLSTWDSYVAGAVMTYIQESKENEPDFDGTIEFKDVRCQAFSLRSRRKMPPCRSCQNMFGLTTSDKREFPYGNCAEAESLSNLLKNEKKVREKARPKSKTCTDENRQRAKESISRKLKDDLKNLIEWDGKFYTPEV